MRRLICKRPMPIFWYFIYQLLVEISIWNSYRTLIGSLSIQWQNIDLHRSNVKVRGTVHCFLKVQAYHKNWAIEMFNIFVCRHLFVCPIKWNNKTWASREMTSKIIRQYLTFNMQNSYTAENRKKSQTKFKKYGSHTDPSYSYSLRAYE